MASSVERPITVFFDAEKNVIRLRIPKPLWNTCQPQPYQITKPQSKFQSKTKRHRRVLKSTHVPTKTASAFTQSSTRQCKARFFRFHYGGPKRQKRGDRQDEITYEAPCLQFTCANCWKWNPHLMCTDHEDRWAAPQQSVEPVYPADEYTTDSTQPTRKRRHDSVFSEPEDPDLAHSLQSCRNITTLAFHSHEGKQKYCALVRAHEAKQKSECWGRLGRRDLSPQSPGSDWVSAGSAKSESSSGRSRHRVRLVFKSKTGKQDFARFVQGYLC
jgi:hypothetical protein